MPDRTFLPPADPFGRTALLSFETTFPVCGVPLTVRSNAEAALELATENLAGWRELPEAMISASMDASLDVVVQPATTDPLPLRLECRRHGPIFMAAGGPVFAAVLIEDQRAVVFVPAQALAAPEWFATHVVEQGILAATQRSRVPLLAAAVLAGDHTLLLTGASGAGKSTMAYACAVAGFSVLGEDAVFVDLSGVAPRLWGYAPQVWLDPASVAFFPELAGAAIVTRGNGAQRIRAHAAAPWAPTLTTAGRVSVVLLDRSSEEPSLTLLDGDEAAAFFDEGESDGFDPCPEERPAVSAWLRGLPTWRLDAGDAPHVAARLLETLIATRQLHDGRTTSLRARV